MYVLRQVKETDFKLLHQLAQEAHLGVINFPQDPDLLKQKIEHSLEAFSFGAPKLSDLFLFVLEDVENNKIIGTSSIKTRSAIDCLEYYYHKVIDTSGRKDLEKLVLVPHEIGPSELCGLYLSREARAHGIGRLLSLGRMLFAADHLTRFTTTFVADLRGVIEQDTCPFWEATGQKLSGVSFKEAVFLYMHTPLQFHTLLPKEPIFISLLEPHVQKVIGNIHPHTEGAWHMLEKQHFKVVPGIHTLDGGPRVEAFIGEIPLIQESKFATFEKSEDIKAEEATDIIARVMPPFAACLGTVKELPGDKVALSPQVQKLLNLKVGEPCRYTLHQFSQ